MDELINLGIKLKKIRKLNNLSLDSIAKRAEISKSLLSKIENFRAIPSLSTISKIANVLNIDLGELFSNLGQYNEFNYILTKKENRKIVEREISEGFSYQSLIIENRPNFLFESFVLTLEQGAKRKLISTNGDQFFFILEGSIEFVLGKEKIVLNEGDSIYFDGKIPHVPKNNGTGKAKFIVIYLIEKEDGI